MIEDRPITRPADDERDRRRRLMLVSAALVVGLVVMAVPLIVVLVGRSSSASFADAEILAANRLGAAELDLAIDSAGPGGGGDPGDGGVEEAAVFSATNLAPGDSVTGYLRLANRGDLPLRVGLSAMTDGGLVDDWLRFEVWIGDDSCDPATPAPRLVEDAAFGVDPTVVVGLGTPSAPDGIVIQPDQQMLLCLGATLPLATPNEAQGQALEVTLILPAEQHVESGSAVAPVAEPAVEPAGGGGP